MRREEQAKLEAERRAEEIQKVNRKLEGAVTEKNEFLRAVSHDLSAPLRNVAGMASFVKSRYADKLDDIGRDRLDRIMNNIKNQNELIQDLLELSRIKTRRGSFQRTDTAGGVRALYEVKVTVGVIGANLYEQGECQAQHNRDGLENT